MCVYSGVYDCVFVIVCKLNLKCNFPITPYVRLSVGWLVNWTVDLSVTVS